VANFDPFSNLRGPRNGVFFEPYARLIQILYPRCKAVLFYDGAGAAVWQKDAADIERGLAPAVKSLVQDATDPEKTGARGCERMLDGAVPGYVLWLRDERNTLIGMVGLACKPAAKGMPASSLGELEKTLQPVLQCLSRELATLRRVPGADADAVTARMEQAEWLADKLMPLMSAATHAEPLRHLLATLVDRTDAALGAIIIPDLSIRLLAEPSGWSGEPAREALRRAHRQILTWMQLERTTYTANKVREQASDASAYRVIATPILQRADQPIGYVALLRSAIGSEFGALEQKLLERVSPLIPTLIERDYDAMTNLRSAAGLERAFRCVIASPGGNVATASVIFVDIAGFSATNRDLSPPVADRLIRRVSKYLRPPLVPENAFSARLDGGHFAVFLPRLGKDDAERVGEQICSAARKSEERAPKSNAGIELKTGVAEVPPTVAGLRYALVAARAAAGTDNVPVAKAAPVAAVVAPAPAPAPVAAAAPVAAVAPAVAAAREAAASRSSTSSAYEPTRLIKPVRLPDALRDGKLRLFGQLMRPVRDPQLPVRIELLPRVLDDRGTLIAPAQFLLPGANPEGMSELDRWVLSAALETLQNHSDNPAAQAAEFSLNISGRSLQATEFHDWVIEQLRRNVVPSANWLFEISETTAAQQRRDVARFAKKILRAGARIAIDNVGSRDGEVGRLQPNGASSIKLDGSLVRDVVSDARAQRLIEALARWAAASRMDIAGVQVENEEVRDWLQRLGIDYIQGFVICRPEPIDNVLSGLPQVAPPQAKFGS
jgi:EAL domain-containing protein (putative c-di-GMP-specific phosphodiesterase class I)/GGDEF domain-containing protein